MTRRPPSVRASSPDDRPSASPKGQESARSLAVAVLETVEREHGNADEAMTRATAGKSLAPRERALLMELVYGVLRHQLNLDWRLDAVSDRKMDRLPAPIAWTLRLGAYQVLHLTRIPHSAAVHEAVALVRRRAHAPHWPGFANAVLRALLRNPPPPLPSLEEAPVRHLALRYSCPAWLVERWCRQWGSAGAEALCRRTCESPRMTLRVNTEKTTREALLSALAAKGLSASATPISPAGIHVNTSGSPAQFPLYTEGGFYVEDEAAQLIPLILDPQSGERVLDACAAPGGKALHCAELMQGCGDVIAVDRSESRLRVLQANVQRLGTAGVQPLRFDWDLLSGPSPGRLPAALQVPFDRILLDAPCSALGILRRHPEGKWHKQPSQLMEHHRAQRRLLETTSRLLRPGGVIVYSTCSTEPEETIQVIDHFCEAHPEFVRESVAPWLPQAALPLVTDRGELCSALAARESGPAQASPVDPTHTMDAFFAARLTRVHA